MDLLSFETSEILKKKKKKKKKNKQNNLKALERF